MLNREIEGRLGWVLPHAGDCGVWKAMASARISHSYWHYSCYCTTGPSFGNRAVPADTFGACILGWASGNSEYKCP